jgi:hypothetical protein
MLKHVLQVTKNKFELSTYKLAANRDILINQSDGPINANFQDFIAWFENINTQLVKVSEEKKQDAVQITYLDFCEPRRNELCYFDLKKNLVRTKLARNTFKKFVLN